MGRGIFVYCLTAFLLTGWAMKSQIFSSRRKITLLHEKPGQAYSIRLHGDTSNTFYFNKELWLATLHTLGNESECAYYTRFIDSVQNRDVIVQTAVLPNDPKPDHLSIVATSWTIFNDLLQKGNVYIGHKGLKLGNLKIIKSRRKGWVTKNFIDPATKDVIYNLSVNKHKKI